MELGVDYNFVRSQKLLLIPQLKQALDILGMNYQELYTYVERQMVMNPILEMTQEERQFCVNDTDEDDYTEKDTPGTISLKEHLLLQFEPLQLLKIQKRIGEYIIDNTDENGYLNIHIREVAAYFNVHASKVRKVVDVLQSFDPPGICARSLRECLKIQLKQMDVINQNALLIVEKYLDMLANNDVSKVSEETGIDEGHIVEAFKLIKSLEPKPGREFYKSEKTQTIMADVIIRNFGKQFGVVLNEDAFPEVNITDDFKPGRNAKALSAGVFLKEKLQSAIWMIKCIEQRKNIILKIADYILKEQNDFFEKGAAFLKPISKKRFEGELDIHELVFNEAIRGKQLHCRWGIYEFKYFFV